MRIEWSEHALSDLDRVRAFLESVDPDAAARVVQALATAPNRLLAFPRLGEPLEDYEPREVRRLIVGRYEMRYEVLDDFIGIVRVWHGREERK